MNYQIVMGGGWWTVTPDMVACIFGMSDQGYMGFSVNSFRAAL